MKAFYYEFFHIPQQGKIRDKVLMARVVAASVLIILCMLFMSLSAYAFYAVGLTTHSTIKTANFAAQLEIVDSAGVHLECEHSGGIYHMELMPDSYMVYLSYDGDAETGFCVIRLNGQEYHTRQFFEQNRSSDELVLMLELYETSELIVVPHWGTSSCYEEFYENGNTEYYLIGAETLTVGEPPEEEAEEEKDPLEEQEEEPALQEETEEVLENTEEFDPLETVDLTQEEVDLTQAAEEADPLS